MFPTQICLLQFEPQTDKLQNFIHATKFSLLKNLKSGLERLNFIEAGKCRQ